MLPSINFSLLIIQGVVFLFALWFLNKALFKPILKVLHEREERTEGYLRKAEVVGENAETTFNQYREKLQQAKKETLEIKRKYILEGTKQREEILNKSRKEANNLLKQIKEKISEEAEKTRETLFQQIEDLGKGIVEKVLGRSI